MSLSPRQQQIFDAAMPESPYDEVIASTGRQVGKTTTGVQILAWYLLHTNYKVGFFLPTYKQAKKVFQQAVKGFAEIQELFKINRADLEINQIKFGGNVKFFTSENDNCRGFTFDLLIIDEACFIKDEIFAAAISPTIAVATSKGHGKTILLSTPKAKNWFFRKVADADSSKTTFFTKFTSEEGGLISHSQIGKYKKQLPEHIFRNEYMGEFVEGGSGIFKYKECLQSQLPENQLGMFAGVDFGIENDHTVLTILNAQGDLIFIKRWRGLDWFVLLDEIVRNLSQFGRPRVWVESNGIGNMPAKELRKKYPNTTPYSTTNKSKFDAINKLAFDFENKKITIPKHDFLLNELDNFQTKTTPTGKIGYEAASGFSDDCVMSLAIANHARPTQGRQIYTSGWGGK